MPTHQGDALREYHERTKHSVSRLRASRHYLDWEIQPRPYKIYTSLAPLPLPRDFRRSLTPALEAVASTGVAAEKAVVPDLRTLARLLYFSAGIIRSKTDPDGRERAFRAAACTGALYHIDLYVVCGALPDYEAGVYHFDPRDFALRRLRGGDYRAVIAAATADEPAVRRAPIIVASASTFWRNAWKYQARAYRHCYWDDGTIVANLLAVAAADGIPAQVVLGFVDQTLNELIGVDGEHEAVLSLVTIGAQANAALPGAPPLTPLTLATAPLSATQVEYPAIPNAHAASALTTVDAVARWRTARPRLVSPPAKGPTVALQPAKVPAVTIDQTILRRGSTREFSHTAITFAQLSALLQYATRGMPADYAAAQDGMIGDVYLIVNAVDQLPPGTYVYDRQRGVLAQLQSGDFRREAGFLDLGQELAADASVNFYMLTDLEPLFESYGNRAYRMAQLDAAIVGGKLYLTAYALGLGATGLTFFDDDVTAFFGPHAEGKSVMFLMAVGVPQRRR